MTLRERLNVHAHAFDERTQSSPETYLWYRRMFLHFDLPVPLPCRVRGHRPVVAGTDSRYGGSQRWVECSRCDLRPRLQGSLPPEDYPVLGARYTGPWTDDIDVEFLLNEVMPIARTKPPMPRYPGLWPTTRRVDVSAEVPVRHPRLWLRQWSFGGKVGVGGDRESDVSVDLHLGPATAYLRARNLFGMRLARRVHWNWAPSLSAEIQRFDGSVVVSWNLWGDRSSRDKPDGRGQVARWRQGWVHPADVLWGRTRCETTTLDSADTEVVLPEARYPVTVTLKRYVRERPRLPFSRRTEYAVSVDTPRGSGGIPVPDDPDCDFSGGGGDHIHGTGKSLVGGPGSREWWVSQGVQAMLTSVLSERARHGWSPSVSSTG